MKAKRALPALVLSALACSGLASTITVEVRDWQDGRDDIILQGNAVQWHHFDYNVPGVEASHNDPTWVTETLDGTTVLDQFAWYPTWSGGVFPGAYSDPFTGLPVSLAGATLEKFEIIAARYSAVLTQGPDSGNGFTTVVSLDDNPVGSADYYDVKMTYSTVPEPATLLLGIGAAGLAFVRRRR